MDHPLAIAIEALEDIANGTGKVLITDEMLSSKETFRESFGSKLQERARTALEEIARLQRCL